MLNVFSKIAIGGANFIYFWMKLFIPTRNKVTLASRQSNKTPLDFKLLSKELSSYSGTAEYPEEIEVAVLAHKLKRTPIGALSYIPHFFEQMYHFASSKVLVLDSYALAASILKHKDDLTIIQMWHSMGTMKRFGYTALDTEEGSSTAMARAFKMHRNYDWVFSSSDAYKQHLADGFDCNIESIVVRPLPRLDLLNSEKYRKGRQQRFYDAHPQVKGRKVILYCPTFRKGEPRVTPAVTDLVSAIDFDEYCLVLSMHPLDKQHIEQFIDDKNVLYRGSFTTFDLLFASDYVISDYSCVVYEAAALDLPVHFYCFDREVYEGSRGLALDYENECPGVISRDPHKIVEAIESDDYDYERLHRFTEKYVRPTPHATRDIAEFILDIMEN